MRRLTWRPRAGDDRGAVAALVAVVLAGGVLLGAGALVVDVGQLYAEREQLQSGADAAALAVARDCARNAGRCTNPVGVALSFADANAKDGVSAVTVVCGRASGLSGCPAEPGNLTACLGTAPDTAPYVEVRTATLQPDGSTLLPPSLAGALIGEGGYRGHQVAACARVAWGPPSVAAGFAVTLSTCEWNTMTAGGATYWPVGAGTPPATAEGAIRLHGTAGATTCPAGPSGYDAPGGFGWLDDPQSTCTTTVAANSTYGGNTGVSASQPCRTAIAAAYASHTPVLMPVYDGITSTGTGIVYHLAGFSAFVLTGYHLPGLSASSWLSGKDLCTGSDKCLYGYFSTGLSTVEAVLGTASFGTSVLKLNG